MPNEVTVQSFDHALVAFDGPKGTTRQVHAAAAVLMGGKALAKLKEVASTVALNQAVAGRYRAAADIIANAFPKVAKSVHTFFEVELHANKRIFATFVEHVAKAQPGKAGWTKKQLVARELVNALVPHVAPDLAPVAGEVVAEAQEFAAE